MKRPIIAVTSSSMPTMDYELSINEISESRRQIGVTVKKPIFEERVAKAAKTLSHRAEIKGFRKGKAPVHVIQKMFGDRLKLDVVEGIWREAATQLQNDPTLEIFGFSNMQVETEAEADVAINVEATLLPKPKLEKLTGLEISYETEKFNDKLVDEALLEARRRGAKTNPVVGRDVAEEGDLVNLSFNATIDGEGFPGSIEDNAYVEIGSGRSVADLESGLTGKQVGKDYDIKVVFPEDYPQETVRGKTAVYKVTVKGLERADLPELTDEFVKENLGAENVSELKDKFAARIKRRLNERSEAAKKAAVFKALYEANPFEIGDLIVEEQMRYQLMRFGVLNPRDNESRNADVSRFKPLLGEQAKQEAAESFLVDALVKAFNVEPTDEQVENWITTQAENYETSPEDVKKEFNYPADPTRLKNSVALELAVEKLLASSKVTEKPKG
jgi:trigger factor